MKYIKEKDGIRGMVPAREDGSSDRAYSAYLKGLNPRENEELQLALASSNDPRFQEFLDRVMSERYIKVNLATIAKGCAIDLKEFNDFWQRASVQAAIAIAQNNAPRLARDLVEDAASKNITCPRCDGLKWIAAQPGLPLETPGYRELIEGKWIRDCPDCTDGKVRRPGDPHARDKMLEITGLINKKQAAVNINFGAVSHSSAVTDLDNVMTIDVNGD